MGQEITGSQRLQIVTRNVTHVFSTELCSKGLPSIGTTPGTHRLLKPALPDETPKLTRGFWIGDSSEANLTQVIWKQTPS